MEVSIGNQLELAVSSSSTPSSFMELLVAQRELVHSQIDHLHHIVFKQCDLTGVNPLSQEMAAGALSIKIGKRPRDLLNPKAVRYMQSVFSIKDAITKKESHEISALFGVTVTQVRDFFTSQRSRVRRYVRLSRDKALRSNASKEVRNGVPMDTDPTMAVYPVPLNVQDGALMNSDPTMPIYPVPLKVQDGDPMNTNTTMPMYPVLLKVQDGVSMNTDPTMPIYPVPLNSVGPPISEEGPSCSTQEETLPGLDESDRRFAENIFGLMRKEETFSGQVKLMEWILQIQNSSVLYWFLTKGGVMILATWLSQAASEEQTSVLHVILKVLSHLPLHKALPVHMSAVLQSVNSLRFYRTSDISNRARFLLSRWSKIFARSQAMKKPNAIKSSTDAQNEMLLKQSISEIMGDESWESKTNGLEDTLATSFEGSENFRKLEPLKLLPAPGDDNSKKLIRGVPSSQTRERRKVLMVEQPGQKSAGRSLPVARSVTASQGRPLSADDIQKAKMRAQFMQSKYGKTGAPSSEGPQVKTDGPTKISSSPTRTFPSVPKVHVRPQVEEHKDPGVLPPQVSIQQESPIGNKTNLDPYEPLWKKWKRVQISWQTPAELRIDDGWSVGTGENSKEVEAQRNRIHREKETVYRTSQEIPSNPKEPWDREMEYDDTLTLEIPTEQPPDADGGVETPVVSPRLNESNNAVSSVGPSESTQQNGNMAEPDLELLAVLLKNPELVFALTSGQGVGGSLSSQETVKLLDMIKANGVAAAASLTSSSVGLVGGRGNNPEDRVEVSLPSPTPSSDPVTSGWRPVDVGRNPFSRQQSATANREGIAVSTPLHERLPAINIMAQQPSNIPTFSHQAMPPPHQGAATGSQNMHENYMKNSLMSPNLAAASLPSNSFYVKPAPISITINTPGGQHGAFPPSPSLPTPTPPRVHEPLNPTHSSWQQGLASNPHPRHYQNDYNAFFEGARDRNEFVGGSGYQSWSPGNSPTRSTDQYPPQMNMGRNYRSEVDRSRPPRNSSGYYNRHGNRRWRDQRR